MGNLVPQTGIEPGPLRWGLGVYALDHHGSPPLFFLSGGKKKIMAVLSPVRERATVLGEQELSYCIPQTMWRSGQARGREASSEGRGTARVKVLRPVETL